jgi:hypothetical protein
MPTAQLFLLAFRSSVLGLHLLSRAFSATLTQILLPHFLVLLLTLEGLQVSLFPLALLLEPAKLSCSTTVSGITY